MSEIKPMIANDDCLRPQVDVWLIDKMRDLEAEAAV
jgi:hypothetical protein